MKTSITKCYPFCSAHWLPNVPEEHKCHRIHGHNYMVDITIQTLGGAVSENGFVTDFWDLDAIVQPIVDHVDHRTLNDVAGLTNPTAELIAAWFMKQIDGELSDLSSKLICTKVIVHETFDCFATVQKGSM
jgi:6-pyruvoyltetrahydropterin/6-carboxytetrahydropterin synthase